jgi:light-regulated signal transduction histidine kinase (bacteriophytochrome)
VAPEIRISAQQDGEHWVISVGDNGIGFDDRYAEWIFGLFKRLHSDAYPGLGLAICRRVIERLGGSIWAESKLSEGSVFHLRLPAARSGPR